MKNIDSIPENVLLEDVTNKVLLSHIIRTTISSGITSLIFLLLYIYNQIKIPWYYIISPLFWIPVVVIICVIYKSRYMILRPTDDTPRPGKWVKVK